MSDNIFVAGELCVTKLCGPVDGDRRRWQFTTLRGGFATIDAAQLARLIDVLITDLRVPEELRPRDWRYLPSDAWETA